MKSKDRSSNSNKSRESGGRFIRYTERKKKEKKKKKRKKEERGTRLTGVRKKVVPFRGRVTGPNFGGPSPSEKSEKEGERE